MASATPVKIAKKRGRPKGSLTRYVTIEEVAEALKRPPATVYGWTRQLCLDGKPVLPTQKLGRGPGSVLVKEADAKLEAISARLNARAPASFFVGKGAKDHG